MIELLILPPPCSFLHWWEAEADAWVKAGMPSFPKLRYEDGRKKDITGELLVIETPSGKHRFWGVRLRFRDLEVRHAGIGLDYKVPWP